MRTTILVLGALALLSACGGPPGGDRPEPGHGPGGDRTPALTLVTSPNGEPLGRAVCADALTVWLTRVDADGDGIASHDEFLADSRRQFARMDRDADDFVTPDELQSLRMPFLLEQAEAESEARPARRPSGGHGPGGKGRQDRGERATDPVMTADTNLDFKVTATEFARRTEEEFARLDGDGDRRLTRDETIRPCPNRPAGPSRP